MWEELPEYLREEIDRVSKKHKFSEEKRKRLIASILFQMFFPNYFCP